MTNTVNNASYSAAFQSIMQLMLSPVIDANGNIVYPHVTSNGDSTVNDYWFPNPLAAPAIHAGIDFNYVGGQGSANPANTLPVFSPVTGVVADTQPEYGGVIIQADGTYHRILHLDSTNTSLEKGSPVTAGATQLGLMGNLGAVTAGQNSGPVHVHYDIFLESNGIPGWQGPQKDPITGIYADQDLRIDPIVYWTRGVNPNANSLTSTGLQITSLASKDYNGDGLPETAGILKEGQLSYINIDINTPHTQDLTVRVVFNGLPANSLQFSGPGVVRDRSAPNAVFVTLPATVDQANPMTSVTLGVTPNEDNANTTSEAIKYSIEAGYLSNGRWVSYNTATTNVFTPVTDRSLFIVDNDTPNLTPFQDTVLSGTDDHEAGYFDSGLSQDMAGGQVLRANVVGYIPVGSIVNPAQDPRLRPPLDASNHPGTTAVYGNGGDDFIFGNRGAGHILLDGGTGNDWILADANGVDAYAKGILPPPTPGEGATIFGQSGNDAIGGGWRNDWIDAGIGHDQVFAYNGNDTILGGSGNDWLRGLVGDDVLISGPDTPTTTESDNDWLFGGIGKDILIGGNAGDHLRGGPGDTTDTRYYRGTDKVLDGRLRTAA